MTDQSIDAIPADCIPAEGGKVIEIDSGPDRLGRCEFWMYWHGMVGYHLDVPGIRAQRFHAVPERHMDENTRVVDRRPAA